MFASWSVVRGASFLLGCEFKYFSAARVVSAPPCGPIITLSMATSNGVMLHACCCAAVRLTWPLCCVHNSATTILIAPLNGGVAPPKSLVVRRTHLKGHSAYLPVVDCFRPPLPATCPCSLYVQLTSLHAHQTVKVHKCSPCGGWRTQKHTASWCGEAATNLVPRSCSFLVAPKEFTTVHGRSAPSGTSPKVVMTK
jgi:hypothetical protein